jgi:hypothetical protein
VSQLCFIGLSHARVWISNGHPASVVVKNQSVTDHKTRIRQRCELRTRWSAVRIRPGALFNQEVTEPQCTDRSENVAFFATFFTCGASSMSLDEPR